MANPLPSKAMLEMLSYLVIRTIGVITWVILGVGTPLLGLKIGWEDWTRDDKYVNPALSLMPLRLQPMVPTLFTLFCLGVGGTTNYVVFFY